MSPRSGKNFWLVKQEPTSYSWDDFVREGGTSWTCVRNFQARNNLLAMRPGDRALFYHSGKDKAVVGVAEVASAAYPDETATEGNWVAVDLKPVKSLRSPVPLASIRQHETLRNIALIKQSRLSVMPLSKDEFEAIISLSNQNE